MKKILVLWLLAILAGVSGVTAQQRPVDFTIGAGFNIGATTPMGLPANIRKINSYQPTVNLSLGAYATRMLAPKWGIGAGIVFENKGMKSGITTRNYHLTMNIVDGDEIGTKTGYFTGKIKNETKISYLTIPVYAVFRPTDSWEFDGGAYMAFALSRSFIGNVEEGTMREDPMHPAIGVTKAEYNYSTDLRRFDTGITLSACRHIYRGLGIKANLQWGLISMLNPSTRKIDMDTYNVYLNIGVVYSL